MAKLSIAIAFLLFTLSFARTPLTQPENDITHPKLPDSQPESDADPTLNQLDKESQHVQDLPELKAKRVDAAVPLTFVQLRPINRHFRIRSRHPFRLCHHHNHHHAYNLKPRTHLDQIPDGKDVIHSSGENSDFENVVVHEDITEIPGEWISFLHHNHHHHDDDEDDDQKMAKFLIKRGNHDKYAKLKLKRQFYDPLDDDDDDEDEDEDEDDKISAMQHEDHHSFDKKKLKKHFHNHHEDEEEQEAEQENEAHRKEKKTGGFMKRIRKFLDPYLD